MEERHVLQGSPVAAVQGLLPNQVERAAEDLLTIRLHAGRQDQLDGVGHAIENRLEEGQIQVASPPNVFVDRRQVEFMRQARALGVESSTAETSDFDASLLEAAPLAPNGRAPLRG